MNIMGKLGTDPRGAARGLTSRSLGRIENFAYPRCNLPSS